MLHNRSRVVVNDRLVDVSAVPDAGSDDWGNNASGLLGGKNASNQVLFGFLVNTRIVG